MDLLFAKYASPFILLDEIIKTQRFSDFIDKFIDAENEKTMWDYFLHKVFDKTYSDFKESLEGSNVSNEQVETTIVDSKKMLNDFIPNN